MVVISEFLPNPVGKDADGEFIELFNSGDKAQGLAGWKIKDASGKTYIFGSTSTINPGAYLALDYKTSHLSLNNNGEQLFLFDNQGNLIDQAQYSGTAPAGESLIPASPAGRRQNNKFVFTSKPTPGQVNILVAPKTSIQSSSGDLPASVQNSFSETPFSLIQNDLNLNVFLVGIFTALILTALFAIMWIKFKLDPKND